MILERVFSIFVKKKSSSLDQNKSHNFKLPKYYKSSLWGFEYLNIPIKIPSTELSLKVKFLNKHATQILVIYTSNVSRLFGRPLYRFGAQTMAPKKYFSSFLFSVVFQQYYNKSAVNDFPMHLVILSSLADKNTDRRAKQQDKKKKVESKDETIYKKVFIHLNIQ